MALHSRQLQRKALGVPSRRLLPVSAVLTRPQQGLESAQRPRPAPTHVNNFAPGARPQANFVSLVNGVYTVQGQLDVVAPVPLVMGILRDVDHAADVFGNVDSSTSYSRPDGSTELLQSCKWRFLAFSGNFECRLTVVADPNTDTVIFNLVSSSYMNEFEGRWEVKAVRSDGNGSSSGSSGLVGARVNHQLSVKPSFPVPPPIARYIAPIFQQQVTGILEDLQREVNRRQSQQSTA